MPDIAASRTSHAFLLDQLAEVDDRRLVAGEELGQPSCVVRIGQTFLGVLRVRRIESRLLEQIGECGATLLQRELVDVDARRHLDDAGDVADDIFEHLSDVPGADVRHVGLSERLRTPTLELRTAAHRILELRPMRLHPKRHPGRRADGRSEQDVVREDDVRGQKRAQRGSVRLDVRVALGHGEVLQQLRFEPRIAIENEHGQPASRQLRRDDTRSGQIEVLGRTLLTDDDDVVAGAAPLACERARVDVRPRAAEQVAVPEENPHGAEFYVRWK